MTLDTDILYLTRAAVSELLPPLGEQIALVGETYAAHAADRVQLPPKSGVHSRPDSVIRALPAYLLDHDVAAVKWVGGFPSNRARGINFINGVIVLSDGGTGLPLAIMDAAEITAARTAAATALCIRAWAPEGWRRASIIGCGEQGLFHARMLRDLNPEVEIRAYDRHSDRIASLGDVVAAADVRDAVRGTEVVISAGPIRSSPTPPIDRSLLGDRYLALPLDFDSMIDRSVVEASDLFLVDDEEQYADQRGMGRFATWPARPHGRVTLDSQSADRVVCANLGIGALDAAYAHVVYRRALTAGAGITLPR